MGYVYLKWDDIEDYIGALRKDLDEKNFHPTGVYGIPRGGAILAYIISYRFNIPVLAAPCEGCIVVDDIADSGKSLSHYTINDTQQNKYLITTVFYHERSIVKPDFYRYQKEFDWIVFPWEMDKYGN